MLYKIAAGAIKKDSKLGARQIRVIASTQKRDRVKDVMDPLGCDISEYVKNPIVLASHDPQQPIGTASPELFSDRVEAVITFAPVGISARADEFCGLTKAGILKTVSIGFEGIDAAPLAGGGLHYRKWVLYEISIVAVPCNDDAVVIERSWDRRFTSLTGGHRRRDVEMLKLGNVPLTADEARRQRDIDILTMAGKGV